LALELRALCRVDRNIEFKGPGRRLGTNEDVKETTDASSSLRDDPVTDAPEEKSEDDADDCSKGVMVDSDDISDSEV
jgi:hypothetical protein